MTMISTSRELRHFVFRAETPQNQGTTLSTTSLVDHEISSLDSTERVFRTHTIFGQFLWPHRAGESQYKNDTSAIFLIGMRCARSTTMNASVNARLRCHTSGHQISRCEGGSVEAKISVCSNMIPESLLFTN